jgi:hypothetical protein
MQDGRQYFAKPSEITSLSRNQCLFFGLAQINLLTGALPVRSHSKFDLSQSSGSVRNRHALPELSINQKSMGQALN